MSLRIVVLGYVVRFPLGGMAWHHLNYVLGLRALGHDVLFLEDSDDYPACYDPSRHVVDDDPTFGLAFAQRVFNRVGLGDCWAYHDAHRAQWHGPMARDAAAFCRSADVVLNVSGVNPLRDWCDSAPVRVLIDTDPLFTQVRHLHDPERLAFARAHTHFFTFGENIATGASLTPDDGLPWRATRQPIALDHWPVCDPPAAGPVTTIMQWDSYRTQTHDSVEYGMKSRSFAGYVDLPKRTYETMTLALGGNGAPRERLHDHGWHIDNPLDIPDPIAYQDYIRAARAEWTVAKHGYVAGRTGWFSERSAQFLATGRPVVTEDTGLYGVLPVGEGLLTFRTPDEAADALDEMRRGYASHCRAARRLAEDCFDARTVLHDLLDQLTTTPVRCTTKA